MAESPPEKRSKMLAVLITGAVVSKGYQEEPAVKFSDSGKAVWFRVGKKVYDSQAEDNRRWVNLNIKGFNYMVDRVKKMQLKEGVYINIRGRLDEDVWTDKTGETRKSLYIVAEDIEYAGGKSKEDSEGGSAQAHQPEKAPLPTEAPGEFTGY